jgi:hypothetical protein
MFPIWQEYIPSLHDSIRHPLMEHLGSLEWIPTGDDRANLAVGD